MIHRLMLIIVAAGALVTFGCDRTEDDHVHGPDTHTHDDSAAKKTADAEHGHEHEEVPIGTFDIGGVKVEAAQGHGNVAAGKESHLVIKLPYNDQGSTVVRAWIGGPDRTLSTVAKGEYAPSHNDYDLHVVAPSPLPPDAQWWVEIEKPDGAAVVGSFPFAAALKSEAFEGAPR